MIYNIYEYLAITFCIGASAFFSASEAAILSISSHQIAQLIEKGGSKAKRMKFLSEKPNEILTTILVGNNIVNIMAASLITVLIAKHFVNDIVTISTLITTIILLIFSEIIPKIFARAHSERLAVFSLSLISFLFYFFWPVIKSLTLFTRLMLGRYSKLPNRIITKEDIKFIVNTAREEQSIDSKQINLLNSVMEFPAIKAKDVMIPRHKVSYFDHKCSFDQILRTINTHKHSRVM